MFGSPEIRRPKAEDRRPKTERYPRGRTATADREKNRAAEGWAVVNTEVARGAFGFPSRFTFHTSELTP